MNMRSLRRLAIAALALLLAAGVLPACAESRLLTPAQLMAQRERALFTGGLVKAVPEASLNTLTEAEEKRLNEAIKGYQMPQTSPLVNESRYYYFYEHLDPLARELYDLILQVARDPVSEGNIAVMMTTVDPSSPEFIHAFIRAWLTVGYDHPELFWLYYSSGEAELSVNYTLLMVNGRYRVMIGMEQPYLDFESKMAEFNRAAEDFLADIDRSASQHDIALQIHDKLMDMVTYDMPLCEKEEGDLGHTAYGALVANTEGTPHFAVCDGYCLAYEYLLQQCGIPVAYIGGFGGPSMIQLGGHAWNIVNIDGEWHEVDSTWDDNQIDDVFCAQQYEEPFLTHMMEYIHNPVFRDLLGHSFFLISTDQMEHYVAPDDVDWSYWMGDEYGICDMKPNECYHVRDGENPSMLTADDDPFAEIMKLAPRAEKDYAG